MTPQRTYRRFSHKGANFRICCELFEQVTGEIVRQRALLEAYIESHPRFATSMSPVAAAPEAPEVARLMAAAAERAGVGPMAAVAGTMAQLAARAALDRGAEEAIVENGGDVYLVSTRPVVVALYAGKARGADRLAFAVQPDSMPLAVCSSSGRMGHSVSLGDCDLATVVAPDAALADAAATWAANMVRSANDIDNTLKQIAAIKGVAGALLVKDARVGLVGRLPELVKNRDAEVGRKITRDPRSL